MLTASGLSCVSGGDDACGVCDDSYQTATPSASTRPSNPMFSQSRLFMHYPTAILTAYADHHHALLLHGGAGDVFRGGRRAVKIDANSDRTAEGFIFIELHLAAERPGLHPTAAAGLQ